MHDHLASASRVRSRLTLEASCLAAAIGIVLYVQHVMGVAPCHLCLGERVPYYAALPMALALRAGAGRVPPRLLSAGLAALCAAMAWSLWLGAFHAGVEHGWWPGPASCSGLGGAGDARPLLEQLRTVDVVACDRVSARLAGLSLAELNALLSGFLLAHAAGTLAGHLRDRRAERAVARVAAA